jgi:iron-sulfur cluster assembly accessory protein
MKIHPSAIAKIANIVSPQQPYLRVEIRAGGCTGFEKVFTLTDQADMDDLVFEGIVLVDPISHELIEAAHLSYKTDLSGNQFVLEIPQATTNCGCGKSFAI